MDLEDMVDKVVELVLYLGVLSLAPIHEEET